MPTQPPAEERLNEVLDSIRKRNGRRIDPSVTGIDADSGDFVRDSDQSTDQADRELTGYESPTGIATIGIDNSARRPNPKPPGLGYRIPGIRDTISDPYATEPKPIGLDFEPVTIEANPAVERKRPRREPKVHDTDTVRKPNDIPSGIPDRVSRKERNTKLTDKEAEELRESVAEVIDALFDAGDWLREAWISGNPKYPVFHLDKDELAEATEWSLRRGKRHPRMAQRIRVTTDIYDSIGIPIALLLPRFKTLLTEIRERGINIRGR